MQPPDIHHPLDVDTIYSLSVDQKKTRSCTFKISLEGIGPEEYHSPQIAPRPRYNVSPVQEAQGYNKYTRKVLEGSGSSFSVGFRIHTVPASVGRSGGRQNECLAHPVLNYLSKQYKSSLPCKVKLTPRENARWL